MQKPGCSRFAYLSHVIDRRSIAREGLAIGRALYAYRLAYGELPESLDELVKAGVMAERYLRDENDQPLTSRREGDSLVVESKGEKGEPWTHRWQGLDPRR